MFRTRAGRFAALVAAGACTAALAGCDSNPEPAPLPTESASASTPTESSSPTPSVTPPTMPAAAKGTSEKSAKAFVRYFFVALNHATATGDTDSLETASGSDCESCANFVNRISDIYGAGGHIESDGWDLRTITAVANQPRMQPVFQLGMFLHPQRVAQSADADQETFKGGKQPMTMFLTRQGDAWKVKRLDLVV